MVCIIRVDSYLVSSPQSKLEALNMSEKEKPESTYTSHHCQQSSRLCEHKLPPTDIEQN